MELIEGSETSANHNRTPGKYPKEYIQDIYIYIYEHNKGRLRRRQRTEEGNTEWQFYELSLVRSVPISVSKIKASYTNERIR